MPPVALRPRSTTEIIDAAVQLLRLHYKELVTAAALFMVPVAVLQILVMGSPTQVTSRAFSGTYVFALLGFTLATVVLTSMSTGATVVIVAESYIGNDVTISAAVRRVVARIWTLLGASLFQGLFIALGFILLVIPGFIFIAWTFAMPLIVILEGKGAADSFSRSKSLASGAVGRILLTLLLAFIVVWIFSAVGGAIIALLAATGHFSTVVNALINAAIRILIYPFLTVVTVLLYYDQRIRKEGYDLELMAKELGVPTPAPSPAVAAT